jgi:hypothetical protein
LDAGQFGSEGGVSCKEALEGVAVIEEDVVGVVLGGVGLTGVWDSGGRFGFWRVGRVVLFVLLVAGDGAAVERWSAWYRGLTCKTG